MPGTIVSEIKDSLVYANGLWAERFNDFWAYKRPEDNIFSLASTLFILQEVKPLLDSKQKSEIDALEELILPHYQNYKNKDGRNTYNFYKTQPSRHFPNGYWMKNSDHFRLPDDIDDTALIYFTKHAPLSETENLHKFCTDFAQKFPSGKSVYNTWFGKNMPKEQDVCALLNLMYLFFYYKVPQNQTDVDTIEFLENAIEKILTEPFDISRHYAHPALIIYHYSRFIYKFPSPLDAYKAKLINQAKILLNTEKVFMFRLLLETSLIKLGEKRTPLDLSNLSFKNFYTFIGAPFAPFPFKISKWLAKKPSFQIFWRSKIQNKALLVEYLVLSEHACV